MAPSRVFTPRLIPLLVAVLGVAGLAYVYGNRLHYPPIRSDGVGYYLYLPAAFIDRDMTLQSTVAKHFDGERPYWAGIKAVPGSDRMLIKYSLGEAVLLAPFFFIAHAITLASDVYPPDGFSPFYQAAAALAGLVYVVLGLEILRRLLQPSFSPWVVGWTLIVMVFGTNLFHYATVDNIFSHAFSFFLFVLFLDRMARWYASPALGSTVALAVVAALITLVRPTNSLVLVFAPLVGITSRSALIERWRFLQRHARIVLAGVGIYALMLVPQFAYWHFVTGDWIINSYEGEAFFLTNPQLANVLFSVRKGLFFWSPVLLLAAAGLLWMRRYKPEYVLPTLVFMPLNLYLIASWENWPFGGSFGHRAFVESFVLFAFGYASLLQALSARPVLKHTVLVASAALVFLSSWLTVKYWHHEIPYDGTTWEQFVSVLPL